MNRKELWLEEMFYNLHKQDYVNGLSGREIIKNISKAMMNRMKHEVEINTLEFLNEDILGEEGNGK